jgi:hypothetical protein
MKKYDNYKNSGVEWLVEIPEHWEVKRDKYLFDKINEHSLTGDEELLFALPVRNFSSQFLQ